MDKLKFKIKLSGVLFVVNAILICGQQDLLCCSLRNVRYTALLQHGVPHAALAAAYKDILKDEQHNYIYSKTEMTESVFHFDRQMVSWRVIFKILRIVENTKSH